MTLEIADCRGSDVFAIRAPSRHCAVDRNDDVRLTYLRLDAFNAQSPARRIVTQR